MHPHAVGIQGSIHMNVSNLGYKVVYAFKGFPELVPWHSEHFHLVYCVLAYATQKVYFKAVFNSFPVKISTLLACLYE